MIRPGSSDQILSLKRVHQLQGDFQTQLQYARNGHTVVRNCIPRKFLTTAIRPVIQSHCAQHILEAYRQKVEVAASSRKSTISLGARKLAQQCQSVEECCQVLRDRFRIPINDLPFLQFFNCWKSIPAVLELAEHLAPIAAALMDVPSIRLYQDSIFWKRYNQDDATPWHVDARMAPFDTSHFITLWIPLVDIPTSANGGTGLVFCSKSHSDFALPYWNPVAAGVSDSDSTSPWYNLEERYGITQQEGVRSKFSNLVDYMPLSVGDVTAHSGWTLHCANGNKGYSNDQKPRNNQPPSHRDRLALAISYVDARAPVRPDAVAVALPKKQANEHGGASNSLEYKGDNEDAWSFRDWVREVPPGVRNFVHPSVPIVWPKRPSGPR
jgi:Phytanoyl-CoA dioxygenase (PhyH)